jgi:hypothetical protein
MRKGKIVMNGLMNKKMLQYSINENGLVKATKCLRTNGLIWVKKSCEYDWYKLPALYCSINTLQLLKTCVIP